jgi:hypothetical protein
LCLDSPPLWGRNMEDREKNRKYALGFTWEDKISNARLKELTCLEDINKEVIKRRWMWVGHVHRMRRERRPRQVLKWTPRGQRNRGRPRGTRKRTYETERKVQIGQA